MTTPRIDELAARYRQLSDVADETGGELTAEQWAEIEGLAGGIEQKLLCYRELIETLEAEAAAIGAEIAVRQAYIDQRSQARKARENRVAAIKERVRYALQVAGVRKFSAPTVTARIQTNSTPACLCHVDPHTLPERLQRVTVAPDNAAAVALWRESSEDAAKRVSPPGFEIKLGDHVRIS